MRSNNLILKIIHNINSIYRPNYPETMNPKIRQVIECCLIKDPAQRATINDIMVKIFQTYFGLKLFLKKIKKSDWITEGGQYVVENQFEDDDRFEISEKEAGSAFTALKLRATVMIKAVMKRNLNRTRDKINLKKRLSFNPSSRSARTDFLNELKKESENP